MLPFRIEKLTLAQVRAVYPVLLRPAFPEDELKPLRMIEQALQRGEYVCCGAMDDSGIPGAAQCLAAAFFVKIRRGEKALMLFDYLVVKPELRCQGIGGRFLRALIDGPLRAMDAVLLEVDEPSLADSPEDMEIRNRRLAFYLRNGLHDTSVLATVYDVTYRILSLPVGAPLSPDAARRVYATLYHSILPPRIYRERVFIEGFDEPDE